MVVLSFLIGSSKLDHFWDWHKFPHLRGFQMRPKSTKEANDSERGGSAWLQGGRLQKRWKRIFARDWSYWNQYEKQTTSKEIGLERGKAVGCQLGRGKFSWTRPSHLSTASILEIESKLHKMNGSIKSFNQFMINTRNRSRLSAQKQEKPTIAPKAPVVRAT